MTTYKFETHIHTSDSSICSTLSAVEAVDMYHAAGFSGIAITDHIYTFTTDLYDKWDDFVDHLLRGYKAAKKRGDEIGLDVILGTELRFNGIFSDFLIYGIDEDFLRANPVFYKLTPKEFFRRHGDDLLIIQAHPFRVGYDAVFTDSIHGVEVFNGSRGHENRDHMALELCAAHPEYCPIKGSDVHGATMVATGWINLERPVSDSREFCELVKGRGYGL